MATATIPLSLPGMYDPTVAPGLTYNADGVAVPVFDDGVDEIMRWVVTLPAYASAPHLKGSFKMEAANTGSKGVVLGGALQAISPGASEKFSVSGYSTQVLDRIQVDNQADEEIAFDLTLNDDSVAAGDRVIVEFSRLGSDTSTETAGDDAVGDMGLALIYLEYTIV